MHLLPVAFSIDFKVSIHPTSDWRLEWRLRVSGYRSPEKVLFWKSGEQHQCPLLMRLQILISTNWILISSLLLEGIKFYLSKL